MSKPGYKDLGISSKEYEEALLLERLFKLVKKNPCSTCLLKKPTHVDLDRYDLLCTNCSRRCSSKIQIGKGLISMSDLERLEAIYDKSKKKGDRPSSRHKKHQHKPRSPSVSSYEARSHKKYEKHSYSDSESSVRHHSKSKQRPRRKEPHRRQPQVQDQYQESYERYSGQGTSFDGYPKPYSDERYSPVRKPQREKSRRDRHPGREMPMGMDGFPGREGHFPMDKPPRRDYESSRADRTRDTYSHSPSFSFYGQPRYPDHYMDVHPKYNYPKHMSRNHTAYDYTPLTRREVPGMMGLVSNHHRGNDLVVRNPLALPAAEERGHRKDHKSQSLALTNGFQAFRSMPPGPKDERVSNNPFAKRNFEPPSHAYDFSNMRESLNPRTSHSRYHESFHHRDFPANKLGNPGFPDSGANCFNRY